MKYCYKCGKMIPDNAGFCPVCGAEQNISPASTPDPGPAPFSNPGANPLSYQGGAPFSSPSPAPVKKKSKAGMVLGIVFGSIALVIGSIVLVLYLIGSRIRQDVEEFVSETAAETAAPMVIETQPAATTAAQPASAVTGDDFAGFWTIPSYKIELNITDAGSSYPTQIYFHTSAATGTDVTMTCTLEQGQLVYSDGATMLTAYSTADNAPFEPATMYDSYCETGRFYLEYNKAVAEASHNIVFTRESQEETGPFLIWERDPKESLSEEYVIWYSSQILLSEYDLFALDKDQLRIARNEIYARHGRKFKSEDLQRYFNPKSWYYGYIEPELFDESWLSQIEKDNIKLIEAAENALQ